MVCAKQNLVTVKNSWGWMLMINANLWIISQKKVLFSKKSWGWPWRHWWWWSWRWWWWWKWWWYWWICQCCPKVCDNLAVLRWFWKVSQGYRPTAHYWQERTFWRIVSAAFSLGPRSEFAKPSLDYAVGFVYLKVWQIISLAKSLPKLLPWRADSCSNILTLDWSQCPDIWSGDILTFCAHIYWHSSVSDILTPGGRRLKLAVCRGKFLGADFGEGGGGGLVAVWGLLIKTCQGLLKPT